MNKISDLIKQLQDIQAEHGDLVVLAKVDGFGGYGVYTTDSAYFDELYPYYLEEASKVDIKELCPEWDGNYDSLDGLKPLPCVKLKVGGMLYAT